jgi:hypothetical protein
LIRGEGATEWILHGTKEGHIKIEKNKTVRLLVCSPLSEETDSVLISLLRVLPSGQLLGVYTYLSTKLPQTAAVDWVLPLHILLISEGVPFFSGAFSSFQEE